MTNTLLFLALAVSAASPEAIPAEKLREQQQTYRKWCNQDFVWSLESLPAEGQVATGRIPYSGYIYPDRFGGTAAALQKYDRAFNVRRDYPATKWEKTDVSYKEPVKGLLGVLGVKRIPQWHGHCNGWAAAAIRHAEPQHSVTANGITFTPSDIKALLAEVYMYNHTEMLAGWQEKMNAGIFHALLANWVGRSSQPLGMEKDPGEEKWNYPLYAYASSFGRHSDRAVEVNTNVVYAEDTSDGEYDEGPRNRQVLFFHYMLYLNARGEISGGYFYPDSAQIDMLWVPLQPKQGGEKGNEAGNPHLDVATVLKLWRKSVPSETRQAWVVVDPDDSDRSSPIAETERVADSQVGTTHEGEGLAEPPQIHSRRIERETRDLETAAVPPAAPEREQVPPAAAYPRTEYPRTSDTRSTAAPESGRPADRSTLRWLD